MNLDEIKGMVDRAWEQKSLDEIIKASVEALQGITNKGKEALQSALKVKSIEDLANNEYVKKAQAIVNGTIQDVKKTVDKAWENKSLQEIANSSLVTLQGVTQKGADLLKEAMNIKTIKDLAQNKYVVNAQNMVNEAKKKLGL